jgi:hypothetical protein
MAVLTVIYAGMVVYAYADEQKKYSEETSSVGPTYPACECKSQEEPEVWYYPEELGIVEVNEIGAEGGWCRIIIDREKEPFPLMAEQPIFLYEGKFYIVSGKWLTFAPDYRVSWQIPVGGVLGLGWFLTGALSVKVRKKE